jgi:hypothetical protein
VTLFQTSRTPCEGNTFSDFTFEGEHEWTIRELGISEGRNEFDPGAGWRPGVPAPPPPVDPLPTDTPDLRRALADLAEARAEVGRLRAAIGRAQAELAGVVR